MCACVPLPLPLPLANAAAVAVAVATLTCLHSAPPNFVLVAPYACVSMPLQCVGAIAYLLTCLLFCTAKAARGLVAAARSCYTLCTLIMIRIRFKKNNNKKNNNG